MQEQTSDKLGFVAQLKQLQFNFWIANIMEMFERLAYFGVRAILPLYLVASSDKHGLQLSFTEKGLIFTLWALFQCLIPMISGGYTDNFGYKKSLVVAFLINITGYILMANASSFWSMLIASLFIGTGTAIFKPPVQGAVAKSVTEQNSSVGFGIFYWVVNIGGALAPFCAASLRGNENNPTWEMVFYAAAGVTALNFIPALFLFKEPEKDPNRKRKNAAETFVEAITTLKDKQFLYFLLIFSGFWLMFMQLWDLLPNFIDEWVNTKDVAPYFSSFFGADSIAASGYVKPEMIININPISIIIFVIPLSWVTGKFKPMLALIIGMIISVIGFVGSGSTDLGLLVVFMIFIFTVGEMTCSPKFSEYIGITAPPDKKALYMGYSNIPFAIGWSFGNLLSGPLYDNLSSKMHFARVQLVETFGMNSGEVASLPDEKVFSTLVEKMGNGATTETATKMLWNTYHPWVIWYILGAIGVASIIGMILFYRASKKRGNAGGIGQA